MMNFTYHISKLQRAHWEQCEKRRVPYIEISDDQEHYKRIFYDVTNLPADLEQISEDVKRLYRAYVDFYLIPPGDVERLFDEYYFFTLLVKAEHADTLAEQLFIYLCGRIGLSAS